MAYTCALAGCSVDFDDPAKPAQTSPTEAGVDAAATSHEDASSTNPLPNLDAAAPETGPIFLSSDAPDFSDVAPAMENCAHEVHPIVRDFRGYAGTAGPRHPDFEGTFTSYTGIVTEKLGADGKPVYASTGSTPATTGPAEFDQWYRDVDGINQRFDDVVLPLTEDAAHPGTFVYDNQSFFPIDKRGWGDGYAAHNFHFTTEIHLEFAYHGGEYFTFRGDDDVFLFINGHLAIDLGGVHPAKEKSVKLDDEADKLGIQKNVTYRMDIFQAERHTDFSTFHIETTLQCVKNVEVH